MGAVCLIWVDGITHVPWQNPTVRPGVFEKGLAAKQLTYPPKMGFSRLMLSRTARRYLFYTLFDEPENDVTIRRLAFSNNYNLLDNIPKVEGFYSLHLAYYSTLYDHCIHSNASPSEPLLDFLSVTHVSMTTNVAMWNIRSNAMRFASIGQKPVFLNEEETLKLLSSADFDPRKIVALPPAAQNFVQSDYVPTASIPEAQFDPERWQFKVESPSATLLVLGQAFYHNWVAYVDGNEVPLFRANYAFQAVPVPSGTHRVEVVYEDIPFRIGARISFITLLSCGIGWKWRRARTINKTDFDKS